MIAIELVDKTIFECLMEQAKQAPKEIALEYEDTIFSWEKLDTISDRVAIILMRMGIRKGSHVGLWSVNNPNWIFTFYALEKLGAIPILINTCYKERELVQVLDYADVEFLCYGEGYRDRLYKDILEKIPSNIIPNRNKCIAIDKSSDRSWKGLKEEYGDVSVTEVEMLLRKKKNVASSDIAAMLFTSGTSKAPKGVLLSHYSLVNNSMEIAANMRWTNKDRMCVAVPMYHCFGVTASLLTSIHVGCTLHLLKYYRTIDVFEKIDRQKCTILNGVPSMFLAMLYNELHKNYNLSSIHSGIIAGSKIASCEYQKICEEFQISHLQTSYGQTETSPCITISNYEDSLLLKGLTSGKKIQNIGLRIFDNKSKTILGVEEIGEIQTRGYHVMEGYYKMPTETKNAFTKDGWLKTGDLGYLDDMGYLHISGRITEMIIRGGENISPSEIEECICNFPNIRNVKAIGIKADVLQEVVTACIVSIDGKKIDVQALKDFVSERLADYKVPKYILQFDDLPYTSSGKVILNSLKQQALDKIKEEI